MGEKKVGSMRKHSLARHQRSRKDQAPTFATTLRIRPQGIMVQHGIMVTEIPRTGKTMVNGGVNLTIGTLDTDNGDALEQSVFKCQHKMFLRIGGSKPQQFA